MRATHIGLVGSWMLSFFLLMGGCREKSDPPVPPVPEDPVLQVSVPGAYGVPGGNQVYNEDRHQLSVMDCPDGTQVYRILDPGERKVLSIHNIPATLRQGDRISLHFRVMVNGYTIQSEEYTDVVVLKLTASRIWLKKDDATYFVLQR